MKNASLMLSSIAVLAIVAGTLAFKAKKFGAYRLYLLDQGSCKFHTNIEPCHVGEEFVNGTFTTATTPTIDITECDKTVKVCFDLHH